MFNVTDGNLYEYTLDAARMIELMKVSTLRRAQQVYE